MRTSLSLGMFDFRRWWGGGLGSGGSGGASAPVLGGFVLVNQSLTIGPLGSLVGDLQSSVAVTNASSVEAVDILLNGVAVPATPVPTADGTASLTCTITDAIWASVLLVDAVNILVQARVQYQSTLFATSNTVVVGRV